MEPEKVIRDGKVAVIVSPGLGSGWSTCADDHWKKFCAFDRGLVELVEAGATEEDAKSYLEGVGCGYIYTGGWRDCEIEWVTQGELVYIDEYDGSEIIVCSETLIWEA